MFAVTPFASTDSPLVIFQVMSFISHALQCLVSRDPVVGTLHSKIWCRCQLLQPLIELGVMRPSRSSGEAQDHVVLLRFPAVGRSALQIVRDQAQSACLKWRSNEDVWWCYLKVMLDAVPDLVVPR